jgi:hypothetical protein
MKLELMVNSESPIAISGIVLGSIVALFFTKNTNSSQNIYSSFHLLTGFTYVFNTGISLYNFYCYTCLDI